MEDGVAPGTIIATRPKEALNPAAGATLVRPLCPYPRAAVFKGAGSPDDPSAYACEAP